MWEDVTALLKDAAKGREDGSPLYAVLTVQFAEMVIGQLIHREKFSLQEAMSGVEVQCMAVRVHRQGFTCTRSWIPRWTLG